MKRIRYAKYTAVLLAAGIALLAAGCGKKAESGQTGASSAAETETSTEASSEETKKETEETEKKALEIQGEAVQMMSGVVSETGTDTVTIKNEQFPDGVTFSKKDAAESFEEGLIVDHEITIFYQGEIKEEDTAGVTVELIRDLREGDERSEAARITGKVVSIGMSVLTVEMEDGKALSFEQDPKPVNLTDGPAEGEPVKILYCYPKGGQAEGKLKPELLTK